VHGRREPDHATIGPPVLKPIAIGRILMAQDVVSGEDMVSTEVMNP